MGSEAETKAINRKLKGIMEYYVKTHLASSQSNMREYLTNNNYFVDPEVLDLQVDQYVEALEQEATAKFHDVCDLILSLVMGGAENQVRKFELLFVDLVKRTLLEGVESKPAPTPIVIIADPNVKSEEDNV